MQLKMSGSATDERLLTENDSGQMRKNNELKGANFPSLDNKNT